MQNCDECKNPSKTLIPLIVWKKKQSIEVKVCPLCFGEICEHHLAHHDKEQVKKYVS